MTGRSAPACAAAGGFSLPAGGAPPLPAALLARLPELLGGLPERIECPRPSGNSHVFRLQRGTRAVAWKIYDDGSRRHRGAQEFQALAFLSYHRLPVPRPLYLADDGTWAIHEWLVGTAAPQTTLEDVDQLADFWLNLLPLRDASGAGSLPLASAACLSPLDACRQAEERLARLLNALEGETTGHPGPEGMPIEAVEQGRQVRRQALAFVREELAPALEMRKAGLVDALRRQGIAPDGPLPRARQVLSPSDFGFHNVLRRPDGSLAFVDFEYFGWDDPAKALNDALLHPGSNLTAAQRERLTARLEPALTIGDPAISARRTALYPVYGLIWCLIALNVFFPERRAIAMAQGQDWSRRALDQLSLSRTLFRERL